MNTIKLTTKDDTDTVVETRIFNLDQLVSASCDGTDDDSATDLILVFSNGDAVRVPASEKASVLAKLS